MAGKGTLTVKVLGDSKNFKKSMGKLGPMAGKAFAAVGAAAVVGAVASISAFTKFQGQMNEAFTLLPGISDKAMGEMTGQVKDFSKEFGVLPDKVVPALYQALSAGVPKDNVFEFLETAQMAAKGGVTDLTTAVDGISSVVNAYGDDVVNATQASDIMFTAVRLGKTNFEELSASLSNVTPIASGLGVKFEDVAAGLATLTAKGVPTAQATTQLRSLFVDLSKAGGKTADAFEHVAGKSFQEFIAAGGDTAGALDIMQQAASDSGVQIQDLFGSVEAGSAALSLAGDDSFSKNIDAMGDSAGATEAAFDQMMTGLGPIFDKVKAWIAVFLIDVGEKLAPIVEDAMERAGEAFAILSDWWDHNGPAIKDALGLMGEKIVEIKDAVVPLVKSFADWVSNNPAPMLGAVAVVLGGVLLAAVWSLATAVLALLSPVILVLAAVALLVAGAIWAYQNFEVFRDVVDAVASYLVETVWPKIQEFAGFVVAVFTRIRDWVVENWPTMQNAIEAVAIYLIENVWPKVKDFIDRSVEAFTAIRDWVVENWPKIQDKIEAVAKFLVETVWPKVKDFIDRSVEGFIALKDAISDRIDDITGFLGALQTAFTTAKDWISDRIDDITGFVTAMKDAISDRIGDIVGFLTTMKDAFTATKDWISGRIGDIVGFFTGLPGRISSAAAGAFDGMYRAFKGALNSIVSAWNGFQLGPWTLPSVSIPGIGQVGGATIGPWSTPNVPYIHSGGTFTAARPGGEGLALLRDGERVSTPTEPDHGGGMPDPDAWGRAAARSYSSEMRRLARAG